jgi:alkaline phosphatase
MLSPTKVCLSTATYLIVAFFCTTAPSRASDRLYELQSAAIADGQNPVAHWGNDPDKYTAWGSHSNRLIPVYTFGTAGAGPGVDLHSYTGEHSPYRSAEGVSRIYGRVPTNTVNPAANYADQTNMADLQRAAVTAGKKHIFLVVFDGMDWQTTQAAAIYKSGRVGYREGRGTGLHWLDYTADGTSQYGYFVASPLNEGTKTDVDRQALVNPGGKQPGGYNATKAGPKPWTPGSDNDYLIGKAAGDAPGEHAYPDSAATATALCSGIKTYNDSINVDVTGTQAPTVAHDVQQRGWAIGVVSSVPISHATPACAYAHNVHRDDYQDLTRDLLGLPSISHPDSPLAGVDVLLGGGFHDNKRESEGQGANFVPGNQWLTDADRRTVDVQSGGRYVVVERTAGRRGTDVLTAAAEEAAKRGSRLLGLFGAPQYGSHLPYQTADGDFRPAPGRKKAEVYSPGDVSENPTLADLTRAALTVLERNPHGLWLMVEAGDVDWANHDNNLDNSIGAVLSGDAAIKVITDWVERNSNWRESLLIVTADHGHMLHVLQPEALCAE